MAWKIVNSKYMFDKELRMRQTESKKEIWNKEKKETEKDF